ncbi:hypothetical protein BDV95DRAFT_589561 [Massariosphaeria phaeospora]|uniref:SRR1-like domain-containing protein n=1 Tax=Massariosphaeria phaeospora TaxID=100035 RepID=A0A7C8IDW8_9PLEO|nr:hypothetical protein BDV95DRAFT_589561 [Massariosphaeria phaeospora]
MDRNSADSTRGTFSGLLTPEMLEKFYKDLDDRRIYSIRRIRFAHEQMEKFTRNHSSFVLQDINGKEQSLVCPNLVTDLENSPTQKLMIQYNTYAALADSSLITRDEWLFRWLPVKILVFFSDEYFSRQPPAYDYELEKKLEKDASYWNKHPEINAFLPKLKVNASKSTKVKKIVGLCVGQVGLSGYTDEHLRFSVYAKHLLAFDTAICLEQEYSESRTIKIHLYNPHYSDQDKIVLQKDGGKRVVIEESAPDILAMIDADTLVFAQDTEIWPWRQVIADITSGFNGPAAIFCTRIPFTGRPSSEDWNDFYESQDHNEARGGSVNRHVVAMFKRYTEIDCSQYHYLVPVGYMKPKPTEEAKP